MCVRIVYVSFAVVVCVSELFKLVRYMVTVRGRHIVFLLIKYICIMFFWFFMGRSLNVLALSTLLNRLCE